jgi:type I restriction enzyme S subunit
MIETNWISPADMNHRINADGYQAELLATAHKIAHCCECVPLDKLKQSSRIITNGIRGPEQASTNFRMLRQQDLDQLWVDSKNALRVSEAQYRVNKRAWCLPGDVLLSIGGYVGTAGKVIDHEPQVTGRHTAIIPLDSTKVDPDYALAFLVSNSGARLLQRFVLGGVQAGIDLDDLREIEIPVPDREIQRAIGIKVRKAERARELKRVEVGKSQTMLSDLFASSSTIPIPPLDQRTTWVSPSLIESRLDCNYNNYAATEARHVVRRVGTTQPLGDIAGRITCGPFGSTLMSEEHDSSGEIVLVQPTDISELFFAFTPGWRISRRTLEEKRLHLYRSGVLLFARVGIYPHCGVLPSSIPSATISSSMIAVELKDDYDPQFFSLFFRSAFGLPLLLAIQKTTAQPTIATDELAAVRVPTPPPGAGNNR